MAVGVDLVGAVSAGWLARADLADLVATCEACDQAGHCTAWLATHVQAEAPPPFCRNAGGIEELAG